MVDSKVFHLGIDLGSSNIKFLLCTANGELCHRSWVPIGGCLGSSLLQGLGTLQREFPPHLPTKVAVTGSGQSILTGFEAVFSINEVVATARGVDFISKNTRTVIDLGGQFSKWILLDREN